MRTDERDAPENLRGPLVKADARAVLERLRVRQQVERGVGQPRRLERARRHNCLAARDLVHLRAREVDGRSLARDRLAALLAVHLNASHFRAPSTRLDRELVVHRDPPRDQRPGDDRAEAFHREDAIDRQPRRAVGGPRGRGAADVGERRAKRVEAVTGADRHRHDRRAVEKRSGHELAHFEPRQLQRVGVGEIGLRERDEARANVEQPADVEVLARLRHHRFVGGDHEHDEVDAADAGEHVLDEALVAGDVNEGEVDAANRLMREPEIDRDAARLLLLEPIGIGPRQGAHERALAVIDVSGRAYDDGSCHG